MDRVVALYLFLVALVYSDLYAGTLLNSVLLPLLLVGSTYYLFGLLRGTLHLLLLGYLLIQLGGGASPLLALALLGYLLILALRYLLSDLFSDGAREERLFIDWSALHTSRSAGDNPYYRRPPPGASEQRSSQHPPKPPPLSPELQEAYATLLLSPAADNPTIKATYRRLISLHHPDRLEAQGATPRQLAAANEQTRQVRAAYDRIRAARGF